MREAIAAISLLLCGCATTPAETAPFEIDAPESDPARPTLEAEIATARGTVETFFGSPFPQPLRVVLAPDRARFNAALPEQWGMRETECWMVGVGAADFLAILSPTAWAREACEHDGGDRAHLRGIITHELTHAYHGQNNPTRDFTGMDDMGWFVEGLAVLVADQLETREGASAADAIAAGAAPNALSEAWSGRYRYGVCGSLVQYIDRTYGRETVIALLAATSNQDAMDRLGVSEQEFLAGWRIWMQRGA
ncbi:MAG: hypothetical protein JNM59_12270 [Hyphomonadaceae bacterium]|nr:hypothetical protein [Hyphomonadaceae bacterium]